MTEKEKSIYRDLCKIYAPLRGKLIYTDKDIFKAGKEAKEYFDNNCKRYHD
jgi:hypothetical protein